MEDATKKNVPGISKVTDGIDKFGKKITGLFKRVFVFSVIYKALSALVSILKNVAMGDEEFRKSLYSLQAALWTAFTPILNVIIPALKSFINWLAQAVVYIGKFFAAISGKSYASMIQNAKGLKQQSDNYKKLGKSAKEAKKQLAGFDDIQILSSDKSGGDEMAGGADFGSIQNNETQDGVSSMLNTIMGVVGGALVALGVLLIWNGQIGPGIGFVIAGATAFGVSAVAIGNSDLDFSQQFSNIMTMVGGALLALGLVLFFKTKDNLAHQIGLGMIVAGAGVLAIGAIQTMANNIDGEIGEMLHGIIAIASGFLLAIGLIMMFSGQITPVSIGLVVTGAVGLASEIALYPEELVNSLRGWLGVILAVISTALLVVGIIMCATGHITPVSVGLIIAGAVGLASVAAVNWDFIVDKMQGTFGLIMGIVSAGILILGIILCCCGIITPLTIGMIIAGAAGLVTVVAFNWDFIVDKVKEVWGKVKQFWNENIAPVFTAQWWADLGKTAINGLIGAIEKGINFIIKKINTLSWDVPDWVPGIGGRKWGFDFKEIKIPRLAQGAVIPPNREFLAVLGDQKHGTNIEAPLQTIVDAFNIALQGNANYGGGNTEVVLEIDGREFGRAVVEQGNKENRRIGTRLVIA